MKNRIRLFGIIALAAVIGTLAGCASTDKRHLKKEGIPEDQRANLYLIEAEHRLERIDGKKQGYFLSFYGALQGWDGILAQKEMPRYPNEVSLTGRTSEMLGRWPVQVSAGEHTIVISNKGLVGRNRYEGTFNFEAGKNYLVRLVTQRDYDRMIRGGTLADLGADLAVGLGQALTGNYIVIVAETSKASPTWFDSTVPDNSWKRSLTAEEDGQPEQSE